MAESLNKSTIYNATTDNISVSVVATFEPEHSKVENRYFVFSYEVTIMNLSKQAVQLLSREWYISDYLHGESLVKGEGVVGQKPIIEPGRSFSYNSWTPLTSSLGNMRGFYYFRVLKTSELLKIDVPQFLLMAGFQKN